jgi:hypothetical protein
MKQCIIVFVLLVIGWAPKFAKAQDLSPADQRKRDAISEAIELTEQQAVMLDSLFIGYARELNAIDARIDSAEANPEISEDQLLVRINVLNQEKKDLKEVRELDIKSVLQPEQVAIYDEKVAPQKPKVLHFGIHNRADCNVCTK